MEEPGPTGGRLPAHAVNVASATAAAYGRRNVKARVFTIRMVPSVQTWGARGHGFYKCVLLAPPERVTFAP
jgi:hypothetical protein